MKIVIEVNLDNDSFAENQAELSEIVGRQIPHNLSVGDEGKLKDSNGNTVGYWEVFAGF